jgi:hypothetical protein
MNLPACEHGKSDAPPSTGWIFSCRPCYEDAMRRNLLKYADVTLPLRLEKAVQDANERIQHLESDIQDMRMLSKQAFVRCAGCRRMKEISTKCRWCHP